jgi:oligopeptide transport system permease protein
MSLNKDLFVIIEDNQKIKDEVFQTKPIGYYKDAWIRFKKNRASLVALIILVILIIMSVIGPNLVSYDLHDQSASTAFRLRELPPKIEGLEWLGFDGTKHIVRSRTYFENLPEGILVSNLDDITPDKSGTYRAVVDFYAYRNNVLSQAVTTLNDDQYLRAKEKGLIFEEVLITDFGVNRVRIDYFAYLQDEYGINEPAFWFGTDGQGRDLFTQLWIGARVSLLIALSVATINIVIGLIYGAISGYFGGNADLIMERIAEILAGLPFLAILTLLLLRYGNQIWVVILAFTLTGWLGIASLTRSQFYRYKSRDYVLAARTLGAGDRRIMARHIFPSAVGTLITALVLYIPSVIFAESTFSFLGIIDYGETTSMGRLLSNGQNVMRESFHMLLFPAIFISLLMLSFNLFGNGLRDAFNPSLRGVEEN